MLTNEEKRAVIEAAKRGDVLYSDTRWKDPETGYL